MIVTVVEVVADLLVVVDPLLPEEAPENILLAKRTAGTATETTIVIAAETEIVLAALTLGMYTQLVDSTYDLF